MDSQSSQTPPTPSTPLTPGSNRDPVMSEFSSATPNTYRRTMGFEDDEEESRGIWGCIMQNKKASLVGLGSFLVACILMIVVLSGASSVSNICGEDSRWYVVETIPSGMDYANNTMADGWLDVINSAEETLFMAAFYVTLTNIDTNAPEGTSGLEAGREIYHAIEAASKRGVDVHIVHNTPVLPMFPDTDSANMAEAGIATVTHVDWSSLFGTGILHSKFILADSSSFFLGSANMDWRSLSQVKELGVIVRECPAIASQLDKVFSSYILSAASTDGVPSFPSELKTTINNVNPLEVEIRGVDPLFIPSSASASASSLPKNPLLPEDIPARDTATVFLGTGPRALASDGWESELTAILSTIRGARKSVCVSVMDYMPATKFAATPTYWGTIDSAFRLAALNNDVDVRLMFSHWNHTTSDVIQACRSLNAVKNIQCGLFQVPDGPDPIPFTRVNHAKYLVTEDRVFFGTSNWSADYFITTGGVGMVSKGVNSSVRLSVQAVFDRDWESEYFTIISDFESTTFTHPVTGEVYEEGDLLDEDLLPPRPRSGRFGTVENPYH